MSSGHDGAAELAVASRHGLRDVLTFDTARGGVPESGEAVRRALGLDTTILSIEAWRQIPMAEVPFIAGGANGGEACFRFAEPLLEGRVLLTGMIGGTVWGKRTKGGGPDLPLPVLAEISPSEYALRAGFIQCPLHTTVPGR